MQVALRIPETSRERENHLACAAGSLLQAREPARAVLVASIHAKGLAFGIVLPPQPKPRYKPGQEPSAQEKTEE